MVFAGAGVSIPPPSNYPNFHRLAEQVSGGTLAREPSEPVDRFLGRLQSKGVKVHRVVKEMLSSPQSQPNELHFDLLRLFPSATDVRVVTTNFDTHFLVAARSHFGPKQKCDEFFAPALPLGDAFSGVVHLHGCVLKAEDTLVLTDGDFGRAYLTEGWARRFLQRLFGRYVVLFVGYSHEDTVVQYLARGLPPETGNPRRFAVTPQGRDEHWRYLGITPLPYPLGEGEAKHSAVGEALKAWVDLAQKGALDHEQKIRSIVELPPPLDPQEADYIEESLKDLSNTRFFCRHAKSLDWLLWVEGKGLLKPLFQWRADVPSIQAELALWVAQNFVCEHAREALVLTQKQGAILSPTLWHAIVFRLFSRNPPRPSADILGMWIPILISSAHASYNSPFLSYALAEFRLPEDNFLAVLLFKHLTRPHVRLESSFLGAPGENAAAVDFRLETLGEEYWLDESWQKFFRPNLDVFAGIIEPTVTAHLQHAHMLLRAAGKASEQWDPFSFTLSRIEEGDRTGLERGLGVLVVAACDIMRWNAENRPARADSLIESWSSSDAPVLKRVAAFGVSISRWAADDKIAWVTKRNLLYSPGMKHEVFSVLRAAYPTASATVRQNLLEHIAEGTGEVGADEDLMEYEKFNAVSWLAASDPNCPVAKEWLTKLKEAHPDFGLREHPDLDFYVGPVKYGWAEPPMPDAVLSKEPREILDRLLSYEPQNPMQPDRFHLLGQVQAAADKDYDWGMRLAAALEERALWDSDLWKALLRAWKHARVTTEQRTAVLLYLRDHDAILGSAQYDTASLLEEYLKDEQGPREGNQVILSMEIARKVWAFCAAEPGEAKESAEDWVTVTINHPAGMIAEFLLRAIGARRRLAGNEWKGFHEAEKEFLALITGGSSYAAALGRVMFASQLQFLLSCDEKWTMENVLPLLDWSIDQRQALQAWQGFLTWGRWSEASLPKLMPLYEQAFPYLPGELGKHRQAFCSHLAGIAGFSSINPVEHGWLSRFIKGAAPEDRIAWASQIADVLKAQNGDAQRKTWDAWLAKYWARRADGVPVPLDAPEAAEMLRWCPYLGSAFPNAVEMVCKGPAPQLGHSFIFHDLRQSATAKQYPAAVAGLALYLLEAIQPDYFMLDEADNLVREIIPLSAPKATLLKICDRLAQLGYPAAAQLSNLVNNG